jgi:2-aminoadipate transaminase
MNEAYLERFLSESARGATRSDIRELLKLLSRPEIISLAGGLPTPEAFPIPDLVELMPKFLDQFGTAALQYGLTEGDIGLRQELIGLMTYYEGAPFDELTIDQIQITTASQQALDLCSRILISKNDAVVCGLPSYLGALGAFAACGARMTGIPLDEEGLRGDSLEQRLVDLRRNGVRPKLLYAVPDFGNPSGVTMSLRRREEILSIAREFDLLVLEDSPYRQLRYVGETIPTLYSLDQDGRVISMFTFSKILFPGLRLGWVVAHPDIIAHLITAKQPVDLCTSGFNQLVAREYIKSGRLPGQIERICAVYAKKRQAFLDALDQEFDPAWGVHWTRPEGGMFLWMTLPSWVSSRKLLDRALEEKVAFVGGTAFHCDGAGQNTIRLNFSYPSPEDLREAAARLARCVGRMIRDEAPVAEQRPAEPDRAPELLVSAEHSLEQLSWNLALSEVVQ